MAVPVVQAQGTIVGSTGNISPAWPAHQAGDIGLLIVETGSWQGPDIGLRFNFVDAAGFRPVGCSPARNSRFRGGNSETPDVGNANSTQLSVFWKRATSSSEPAPTIGDSGDRQRGLIITIRGAAAAGNPIHRAATFYPPTETTETSISVPGFTTADADCLILDIASKCGTVGASAWTNASVAGLASILDSGAALGAGSGLAIASSSKAVAGAVSATTFTVSAAYIARLKLAITPSSSNSRDRAAYFVHEGALVESASGNVSPAWPAHQTGDIGLLVVETGGWPVTLGVAAGFVEIPGSPQDSGSSGSIDATGLHVYWCRATSGAMGAPTVNFVTDHIRAVILVFRNIISTGNPYDATAGNTVFTNTISFPAVTTTKANELIVSLLTDSFDDTNPPYNNPPANANLFGVAKPIDTQSLIGSGSGIFLLTGVKETVGSTGNSTMGGLPTSAGQGLLTIAFTPPVSGMSVSSAAYNVTANAIGLRVSRRLPMTVAADVLALSNIGMALIHAYVISPTKAEFILQLSDIGLRKRLAGGWIQKDELKEDLWTKQAPLLPQ